MRYIKKENGRLIEYIGPSLGGPNWYLNAGWYSYTGNLPLSRLDIQNKVVVELPEPEIPQKLSKLKLMRELKRLGVWETFKSALTDAGYWEEFELAHYLSTADADFTAALEALNKFADGINVDDIIAASLWEE